MYKLIQLLLCAVPLSGYAISSHTFFNLQRAVRQVSVSQIKADVMHFDAKQELPSQTTNGDLNRYSDLRGNFGKALDHESSGFINRQSFNSLIFALQNGDDSDFDQIILGGMRRLVNPQAAYAYSLAANDGWLNAIEPAPAFSSSQSAGEMVELYWTVLVRDIPFNNFIASATATAAIEELNTLSNFKGPKVGGMVTAGTFLRGNTPGDLIGPYISQFLYQTTPYGATSIGPEIRVPTQSIVNDFITDFTDWFTVIDGGATGAAITYDGTERFIRTPRDLGEFVHQDFPGQAFLSALLLLNSYGSTALDPNNPYKTNQTQEGFVTYGIAQAVELLSEAIEEGLKTAWYQKWLVHRRLRPEEYGFYVDTQKNGTDLGINSELINSNALDEIFAAFGSYFLPQAYPEGCPTHPSYPAGHAVISGACATILKAFFDENFVIPSPLEPNLDNTALVAYGGDLIVGDELNKLAANISLGRDHAGVHYRSDGYCGMLLGEKVAIDILNNCSFLNNENFAGFTLTKFNGQTITVGGKR